jgi:hypothetical protein
MREVRGMFLLLATVLCVPALFAYGQDAPSLADLARQKRAQKQQDGKEAHTPTKSVNDDENPNSAGGSAPPSTAAGGQRPPSNEPTPASKSAKLPAEQWKSQILAQKNQISTLQSQIDKLNDSIHFAPANCVSGCVQWNERQKEKQQEVDRARTQLEDQKKRLQDMQNSARQQGYGNSVYDP